MFTVYIYSVNCQHNYKVKTSDETGGDPEGKNCKVQYILKHVNYRMSKDGKNYIYLETLFKLEI